MGQSFTIQTSPSRSMMRALISPTFSLRRDCHSWSPLMILSRASFTHPGQSESVSRGQPSCGLVFSQDFRSGLSDHRGMNDGLGLKLLKYWTVLNVTPAATETARSTYFIKRLPLALGMVSCSSLFSSWPATVRLRTLQVRNVTGRSRPTGHGRNLPQ